MCSEQTRCLIFRVLVCSVYPCQPTPLHRPNIGLLDPQTFFLSRIVSYGLSWRAQDKMQQVPDDLQAKRLYTAAKPSQSGVKTIPQKRTVCPGTDLLQKRGQRAPVPCPGQVTWKPRYWTVSTGEGAIRHRKTFMSGHRFPQGYAHLHFKKW